MMKLAIIGASGHGKVVADIARKNGYSEIVFLDDNESIHECGGYPVIGKSSEVRTIDAEVIIGIGNADIRKRIQESVPDGKLATLIHPDAVVAEDVVIGAGVVIMNDIMETGTYVGVPTRRIDMEEKIIKNVGVKHSCFTYIVPDSEVAV